MNAAIASVQLAIMAGVKNAKPVMDAKNEKLTCNTVYTGPAYPNTN